MSAEFPNVPDAPGVPQVLRDPAAAAQAVAQALAPAAQAAISRLLSTSAQQWGIYKDGALVITGNAVTGYDFKKSYKIASHPVEEGSFASYNKVEEPYTGSVSIAKHGSSDELNAFLKSVDAAVDSLTLYDIVTPSFTRTNANLTGYDYGFKSQGPVSMVVVSIAFQQIRIAQAATFATTANPEGRDNISGGSTQMTSATTEQTPATGTPGAATAASDARRYVGGQPVGSGQCVALVQDYSNVGHTSTWVPGQAVQGADLAPGTPVATFDSSGKYGNHTDGTSHAAVYMGQDARGMQVIEQWKGRPPQTRTIPWSNPGHAVVDQASNYRVINH